MRQTLQLKLSQHLALTPQLQQSIRLLQLSTLELNQEIEQALQENPLLEREEPGDAMSLTTYSQSSDAMATVQPVEAQNANGDERPPMGEELGWGTEMPGGHGSRDPNDESDPDTGEIQAAATSLRDHLNAQLGLTQIDDRGRALVSFLVEALDEDGYLTQNLEELADVLPDGIGEEREELLEELAIALRHLQNLDPPGIGARSPQECLSLQLINEPASPVRDLAAVIVRNHLDHLAARDFARIKKALGCDDDALRAAHALIRSLNPRPGAQYAPLDTRYVIPDVTVRKYRGNWVASLNPDAMPRLRINRLYADLLQKSRSSGGANLSGQLQEAKWLIKNVQQRFDTILRVAQAIVDRQRAFFDHGEVAMRPLTLREIAETVELHESTISRVTTQKYLASPRGIFELKYFFGSHVATDTGGAASSTAIRALIKQLVSAEDGHKPLSDAKIAEILGEQGIVVARRTVAKYRESLNIPPVNLRKTL
ncbi:MAG: RNA polymerase factor sigma-54 [Sterolibacteriaceae bacterium MAG5]|nr:RNA polymerase factor sigma-54 [Candidatus Nitricoxidireducens bremensis]